MMADSSGLAGRKRFRDGEDEPAEENSDGTLSLGDSLTFCDTVMALRMMRAQFPKTNKVSVEPFILRSQLYSCIKNRTQVDRDLEALKKEKTLRLFKLNTGQDDHAIMFMDDYNKQIGAAAERLGKKGPDQVQVLEWFKLYVLGTKLDLSIEHNELVSFSLIFQSLSELFDVSYIYNASYVNQCSLLSAGGKVRDEHVSLLVNAGFLTRQLVDPDMYWFSIPNVGSVLKGLSQGRKEVMGMLKRRAHGEMMMGVMEKKRLRFSPLDMRFHLRDLIGSGHLHTAQTPLGLVVRLAKD
ncbi:serine/Threonine-kinase isoform X1 [Wolffia australiana]